MGPVWTLLGMLLTAAAVLAAAYGVTRWIASRGAMTFSATKGGGELRVLRSIPVGRDQRLLLVRLHQRVLLLGTGTSGVSLLTELTEEEARVWLSAPEPVMPNFWQTLQENLQKKK